MSNELSFERSSSLLQGASPITENFAKCRRSFRRRRQFQATTSLRKNIVIFNVFLSSLSLLLRLVARFPLRHSRVEPSFTLVTTFRIGGRKASDGGDEVVSQLTQRRPSRRYLFRIIERSTSVLPSK